MAAEHWILAVDIGTTAMKMGVFTFKDHKLVLKADFSQNYSIHTYNNGQFSDIDQQKWKRAFMAGCKHLASFTDNIDAVSLSGTTPGLSAMDQNGEALYPAILMLDRRSGTEARHIIDTIGLETLLATTGNMPVPGGCSLAGILWLKKNQPDIFNKTACFGHSNTYIAKWLTGKFAIDPSSASLSALYNTVTNDKQWNADIAGESGIEVEKLPVILPAYGSPGRVLPDVARLTGLTKQPAVLIGGNDAVLAAWSAGIREPGDIINVNGTCEICLVCLPDCLASVEYNVRNHIEEGRWLTLYVMNAGGKAYEWFRNLFCSEKTDRQFFEQFLPSAILEWLEKDSRVRYTPYLLGSRYSTRLLYAAFENLTAETTREEMAAAVTRGLCEYQRKHLSLIAGHLPLKKRIHITGGALSEAIIEAKKKWMWNGEYRYVEQSSLLGAAMLWERHLNESRTVM
ncbi:hypothetical protein JW935_19775 [candidate division KSB1 bacterium]|nr:hypothetical protein [candidate division KSB1 bacterium]